MHRAFANKHWTLERATSQLLLVVRRTEAPYLRVDEIRAAFSELEEALNGYKRKYFSLLIDMRSALQRNDPEFEKATSTQPEALSMGFARVAVLVRTASGLLQVARHIRTHGSRMEPFNDEASALKYLFPGLDPSSGPPSSGPGPLPPSSRA